MQGMQAEAWMSVAIGLLSDSGLKPGSPAARNGKATGVGLMFYPPWR